MFPNAKVRCLTGDREFVGKDWCSYLLLPNPLPFRLRLRQSDQIRSRSGKSRQSGERVFASLRDGETRILSGQRWVGGRPVYVVATRLSDGELLILATNAAPQTAVWVDLAFQLMALKPHKRLSFQQGLRALALMQQAV